MQVLITAAATNLSQQLATSLAPSHQVKLTDLVDCQTDFEFNSDQLLIVLTPGQTTSLTLTCLEVPRPGKSLVFRFAGSGLGTSSPTIDIPFSGLRNR